VERVALDTTFLIDLQNERRARGRGRGAVAFLESHPNTEVLLPTVALGEYLEGFDPPDGAEARAVVASLRLLDVTAEVARRYAIVARALRAKGRLIGSNDLWIGCTAVVERVPLATRNADHFRRIPELEVVAYAESS
jgi:tRNA(fMet)-specific endonuclease VapC